MKNIVKTTFVALTGFTAIATFGLSCCKEGNTGQSGAEEKRAVLSREEIKERSFSDLFGAINVKEIPEDVFKLISEDFAVLTAGTPSHYNSMVAGWGGWGVIFSKPSTFLMLRSSRYTLELMRKEQKYTMAFFDEEYKGDVMEFGKQSGRDSDAKMKNTKLTAVQTPAGNMAFKEAKLIIECKLVQVTTVSPDDFYTDESKKFVTDAYAEVKGYHKVVFGEITDVWARK
ncbi:MAG: flavin reductase [Chitinispirillales bacterium]|jgi:flavin reductase (DIM6/NTAB) family NADH-FMN oxidoreductase RutF|nr:flavin reductase [Chitinispirillales bacterium]